MKPLILVLAVLCSACLPAPPRPASEESINAAQLDYIRCMDAAAKALDDHRSDASTIAMGVSAMCRPEFNRSVDLVGQQFAPEPKLMFKRKAESHHLELATSIVLKRRQSDKEQNK